MSLSSKAVAAILIGILGMGLSFIPGCNSSNASTTYSANIDSVEAYYGGAPCDSEGNYTVLAGFTPLETFMRIEVKYSNGDIKTFEKQAKSNHLEVEHIEGPLPIKNGEVTTYRLFFDPNNDSSTTGSMNETVDLHFIGAELQEILSATYTGNAEDGTTPPNGTFDIELLYSNGTKCTKSPEKVDGPPLTEGEVRTYTLIYANKSITIDITGMPKGSSTSTSSITSSSDTPASMPSPTTSQSNALRMAKQYLDYAAFSYSGLIKQLEYEGFSNADATYAVDSCGADWNAQAAKKAQEYLNYTAFSRQGLIDQLEFEGFSPDQAVYGVTAVGL